MPGEVSSSVVAAGFPSENLPQLFQAVAKGTAASLDAVPGMSSAVRAALVAAQKRVYSTSFATVYLTSLAFGGIALITCFFTTNDIDAYFTNFLNKTVSAKVPTVKGGDDEKSA
jgi:hypothetical protein